MKNTDVRKITGIAILMAIEIILQVVGNLISFPGGVNINLSLIPIALGAIVYGPFAGLILGFANGFVVLLSPSTQSIFFANAPLGTLLTCLLKTSIAGLVAGYCYKAISKKNTFIASIVASIIVPVINTALFALGAFTVMIDAIKALNENSVEIMKFIFLFVIGWNFVFEFSITAFLTPTIDKLRKVMTRSNKHAL